MSGTVSGDGAELTTPTLVTDTLAILGTLTLVVAVVSTIGNRAVTTTETLTTLAHSILTSTSTTTDSQTSLLLGEVIAEVESLVALNADTVTETKRGTLAVTISTSEARSTLTETIIAADTVAGTVVGTLDLGHGG